MTTQPQHTNKGTMQFYCGDCQCKGGHFKTSLFNYKLLATAPLTGICHFFFNSNTHNWIKNAKQTLLTSEIPFIQLVTFKL